jgi:hypothetical protein
MLKVLVDETRVFVPGYGVGLVTGVQPARGTGRTFVPGAFVVTLDQGGTVIRTYYDLLPESADTGERREPA